MHTISHDSEKSKYYLVHAKSKKQLICCILLIPYLNNPPWHIYESIATKQGYHDGPQTTRVPMSWFVKNISLVQYPTTQISDF